MLWIHKHAPKTLEEFIGNREAVARIVRWIENWKNEKKKALLIYGPPGVGKTTLMGLLAKKFNYLLIETNASDVRSADVLRDKFEDALQQASLFHRGKLMVFDEVDGIAGSEDKGAVAEIINIIKKSKFPVILIANDAYVPALRPLRDYCEMIEFKKIDTRSIARRLKEILIKEGITFEEEAINTIANNANGDLKAAINDLQIIAQGKKRITAEDVKIAGYRDTERNIFEALRIIFKTERAEVANWAVSNLDKDPDEFMLWIRENVPLEYEKSPDLKRAYYFISRADVFRGRIRRQQYWRFIIYVLQLLSIGVATAKDEKYRKFVKYRYPSKLKKWTQTKEERERMSALLEKLSKQLHCSKKVARSYLPLLRLMKEKDSDAFRKAFGEEAAI